MISLLVPVIDHTNRRLKKFNNGLVGSSNLLSQHDPVNISLSNQFPSQVPSAVLRQSNEIRNLRAKRDERPVPSPRQRRHQTKPALLRNPKAPTSARISELDVVDGNAVAIGVGLEQREVAAPGIFKVATSSTDAEADRTEQRLAGRGFVQIIFGNGISTPVHDQEEISFIELKDFSNTCKPGRNPSFPVQSRRQRSHGVHERGVATSPPLHDQND